MAMNRDVIGQAETLDHADRLTGERRRRPSAKKGWKADAVSVRASAASCLASRFGPQRAVWMRDPSGEER